MKGGMVYIVTNVEYGWDCVCGVFVDLDEAYIRCAEGGETLEEIRKLVQNGDTGFVIHKKIIQ